jgi:hypothetical protein
VQPSIARLRARLPLIVFVLLLLLLVMLVGFACACLTDHPMQAIDRALSALASLPAVIEVWGLVAVTLLMATRVVRLQRPASGRASPALLQRFLF